MAKSKYPSIGSGQAALTTPRPTKPQKPGPLTKKPLYGMAIPAKPTKPIPDKNRSYGGLVGGRPDKETESRAPGGAYAGMSNPASNDSRPSASGAYGGMGGSQQQSSSKPAGAPKPTNKSNPARHTASQQNPPAQQSQNSSGSSGNGGGSSSGGGGGSSPVPAAAAAVAKSQKAAPKPGKWYQEQRDQFQAEAQNRRAVDAEGNAPQSAFDWSMSSGDVKKARDEWLSKHSALRKAIKNGTMTMGDANLAVRRMSAKAKAAAPPPQ